MQVVDARIGQVLGGRYRVLRRFGEGGMGAVYEAVDEPTGRKVAVKCLHPQLSEDQEVIARFQREAQAASGIGNEHIVEVIEHGKAADGSPYLALELLEGIDLATLIREKGPLGLVRACHIFGQICEALGAAHGKGIVHRDLKPENVFLVSRHGDDDFIKVLDFGIAGFINSPAGQRLTRSGTMMGTPYFMAPEQALGRTDTDQRADIWAIGVLLYHCLTARFPFHSRTLGELVLQICSGQQPPIRDIRPDLPPSIEAVVNRCLEKGKEDRYPSCEELGRDLRDVASATAPWDPGPPSVVTRPLGDPVDALAATGPQPQRALVTPAIAETRLPDSPPVAAFAEGTPLPPTQAQPAQTWEPLSAEQEASATVPSTRPAKAGRSPLFWLSIAVALLVALAIGVFALYVAIRRAQRPRYRPRTTIEQPRSVEPSATTVQATQPSPLSPPASTAPAPATATPASAAPAPTPATAAATPSGATGDAGALVAVPSVLISWQAACTGGHDPGACWRLGGAYQNARGTPRNIAAAVAAYERGCQLGHMAACNDVGFLYQTGRHGAPRDLSLAVERYRRSCDGGELLGCNNLASAFFLGQGVPRDLPEAARLYASCCQRGSPTACTNIGLITVRGEGVRRDVAMGLTLLERACTLGHVTGCREAADLYRRGRGVPRDGARAAELDQRATQLGSARTR